MVLDGWPGQADLLDLEAPSATGACLAWARPGPHPRAPTRSLCQAHGPRLPAKGCREERFVSSELPPLEYLLLHTLRSNPAAAMQRGAGDGPIATPGRLGGQVKSSGSEPASGAQISRRCMKIYDVVVNFHTCIWNRVCQSEHDMLASSTHTTKNLKLIYSKYYTGRLGFEA